MGRAIVFHASAKGRVKQFGACHKGGGGALFFMQSCWLWDEGVNLKFLCSHSHSCNMEHILYLMTVEYKRGFLMTLLGPTSRYSPDLNKQYIVKIECKIYLFNN